MELESLKRELDEILGSPEEKVAVPLWSTQAESMIKEVESFYFGPIKDEGQYKAVQDRLRYLKAYLPLLKGEQRSRCSYAISVLEERINEYNKANLGRLVSLVADFVAKPIETDEDLNKATEYLRDLTARRRALAGRWARSLDLYIDRLKERISEYRERPATPAKVEAGSPEEIEEEHKDVPEWLRPFYTHPRFYSTKDYGYIKHPVDSKYCRVEVIVPDKEYRLGFEDRDQEAYEKSIADPKLTTTGKPDWDYDEPLLRVVKTDNTLSVTVERYGGSGSSRVYYGDKMVFDWCGGWFNWHVGETKYVDIATGGVTTEPTKPEVEEVTLAKKFVNYLPYIIGLCAIAGTIAIVAQKPKE